MEHTFSILVDGNDAIRHGYERGSINSTAGERARRRLYDLYLCLILVIETYYRRYEPNDQLEWSYPLLERFLGEYGQ